MYKKSTKDFNSFFLIDTKTKNPNLKYRHNFTGYKIEQSDDEQDEQDEND
jgi:hypothetical protein